MKITLSIEDIAEQLRQDKNASWSYEGANALAEHLDTNEDENAEFELADIRGEFAEYADAIEAAEDCGWEITSEPFDEEVRNQEAWEWLNERTCIIEVKFTKGIYMGGRVIIATNF